MPYKNNSNIVSFNQKIAKAINAELLNLENIDEKSVFKIPNQKFNIKLIISPKTRKNLKNNYRTNLTLLNQKTKRSGTNDLMETSNNLDEEENSEITDNENSYGIKKINETKSFENSLYKNRIKENNVIVKEQSFELIENKNNKPYIRFSKEYKPLSKEIEQSKSDKNTKYSKSINNKDYKFKGKIEVENRKINENENISKNSKLLEKIKEEKTEKIKKEPKGLYNFGLNCYMNSLLQCFYYIKELREYFIKTEFKENQPICKALANVMKKKKKDDGKKYYEPKEFKALIGQKNKLFEGCKAADVKDLFFNLIDSFMSELDNDNEESSFSQNIDFNDKKSVFEATKKEINEKNIINELFIGYYLSIYKCQEKEIDVYSFQNDSFLLFELGKIKNYFKGKKDNGKLTIDKCLKYYYREQTNSSFYCNKCDKQHIGKVYEKIYRPPKILVLILDRGKGKAFEEEVEIKKTLDLKEYIEEEDYNYNSSYNLVCVSTHQGSSSSSGHYIACCLTDNDEYYYFSDTSVCRIKEHNLFKDEPYLLFYKRNENKDQNNKQDNKNNVINQNSNLELNKINNINPLNNQQKELIEDIQKSNEIMKKNSKILNDQNGKINKLIKNISNNNNNIHKIRLNISSNNNENENILQSLEKKSNKIKENVCYNHEPKIRAKNKNYNIHTDEIQKTLEIFLGISNKKYTVSYYYDSNKNPYVWKLIIKGPPQSIYRHKQIIFQIDFNKVFNKITDNITIENKIFHINFGENGLLLFDVKYKDNKSFYENLLELFDLIYNLFVEPNCEISEKYSKKRIKLYRENKKEYFRLAEESVKIMEKIDTKK